MLAPPRRCALPARAAAAPPHQAHRLLVAVVALVLAASASYTVEPGDTLSGIAGRHGTTVAELSAANGLDDPDRIFTGQVLQLSGGSVQGAGATHTVAPGETLSGIAPRYGVSVSHIVEANELADPNRIVAGTALRVPGAGATTRRDSSPSRSAPGAASRASVDALLTRTAQEHGWNPAFVKAVAWQESGWNNDVVSWAGAVGIMQVLPETGEFVSRHLADRPLNLYDPADNVLAGVLFLDYLYRLTGGDVRLTLAGYFQGLRSVRERGVMTATERYIANVLALREQFS